MESKKLRTLVLGATNSVGLVLTVCLLLYALVSQNGKAVSFVDNTNPLQSREMYFDDATTTSPEQLPAIATSNKNSPIQIERSRALKRSHNPFAMMGMKSMRMSYYFLGGKGLSGMKSSGKSGKGKSGKGKSGMGKSGMGKSGMGKSGMGSKGGSKSSSFNCVPLTPTPSPTKSMMSMMSRRRELAYDDDDEVEDESSNDELDIIGRKLGMSMSMMRKKKYWDTAPTRTDLFVSRSKSIGGMMKKKSNMGKSGSKGMGKSGKHKGKSKASVPTLFCSDAPSVQPTVSQAPSVSSAPSMTPTISPSDVPSKSPSDAPSKFPSKAPSDVPSKSPSDSPSHVPSKAPSDAPSKLPSKAPSDVPSKEPSDQPSMFPTSSPSDVPTRSPSASPSARPTSSPSASPSATPTAPPTPAPTNMPTLPPTNAPTVSAAPSSSAPAEFELIENRDRGKCRVSDDGQCVFSDEGSFQDPYPPFGSCTFQLTKRATLNVIGFSLTTGDSLTIGTDVFSGTSGPNGLSVGRFVDFVFFADNHPVTTAPGFVICIVPV